MSGASIAESWHVEWCFATRVERLCMCARGEVPGWVLVVVRYLGTDGLVLDWICEVDEGVVRGCIEEGRRLHNVRLLQVAYDRWKRADALLNRIGRKLYG